MRNNKRHKNLIIIELNAISCSYSCEYIQLNKFPKIVIYALRQQSKLVYNYNGMTYRFRLSIKYIKKKKRWNYTDET